MRWHLGLALVALTGPLAAQDGYLDDRSSPQAVVASLYNAINNGDFARAWSYFDSNSAPSYTAYIRGFDETEHIEARMGEAILLETESGMAWQVPVVLEARQSDGTMHVFSGCYNIAQAEPRRRPPYAPIAIQSGHFHVYDGPADAAQGDCHWETPNP